MDEQVHEKLDRAQLALAVGEEHTLEHQVRQDLLRLIGATIDEWRFGLRVYGVDELATLVTCWWELSGVDTPSERVISALRSGGGDGEGRDQ